MAREADIAMPILAGPEIGVASTKAFTAQLTALAALALSAAQGREAISDEALLRLTGELLSLPRLITESLELDAPIASRGARITLITDAEGAKTGAGMADDLIVVPSSDPFIAPLLTTIAMQLLAYHTAVALGTDVDQPRKSALSV